jgi:quercetin dioxygenase-like cupin family protein
MRQRPFDAERHIVNLENCPKEPVTDGDGGILEGIFGFAGVASVLENGHAIGVDIINMAAGSAFPLHTHPGAHILVIREGRGSISVDGVDYHLGSGDTIFVPAQYPHGVSAGLTAGVSFLAFGVPHMPLSHPKRMTLVEPQNFYLSEHSGG